MMVTSTEEASMFESQLSTCHVSFRCFQFFTSDVGLVITESTCRAVVRTESVNTHGFPRLVVTAGSELLGSCAAPVGQVMKRTPADALEACFSPSLLLRPLLCCQTPSRDTCDEHIQCSSLTNAAGESPVSLQTGKLCFLVSWHPRTCLLLYRMSPTGPQVEASRVGCSTFRERVPSRPWPTSFRGRGQV